MLEGEYLNNLKLYLAEYEEKKQKLEQFYAQDDLENYQITVHAVKSTSKLIGANELSDLARALEEAAGSENKELVHVEHAPFMESFIQQNQSIAKTIEALGMQETQTKLEEMTLDELKEFCANLQASLDEFDMEEIRRLVVQLQNKDLLKNVKETMQTAVDNFDYDGVQEQLQLLRQLAGA